MASIDYGDSMTKKTRPRFNPEFKIESAQLVLDQGYSVRGAAEAMGVGVSTLDKWVRKLKSERGGELTTGKPITEEQREIAELKRQVKDCKEFNLLKTINGIGDILAETILLETGDISRFSSPGNYASYCRCVDSASPATVKRRGWETVKMATSTWLGLSSKLPILPLDTT